VEINLVLLRNSIDSILTMLTDNYGAIIEIDNTLYWNVPDDELVNIEAKPSHLDLGDLDYEYELIRSRFESDFLIPVDLQDISALLRMIAIEHPAFSKKH